VKEIARRIAALPKENTSRDRIVIITQGSVDTCLCVQIVIPVVSCFLLKRHTLYMEGQKKNNMQNYLLVVKSPVRNAI
jgi:hypothetical protein